MRGEQLKAVLFDFEGTLVDFQWNLRDALRQTLEMLQTYGFDPQPFEGLNYSRLMVEAQKRSAEAGCSAEEVRNAIGLIYDRFDEDALARWSFKPDAGRFLTALKSKRIKTAVVSNVGKKTLAKALAKFRAEEFFDTLISRNDVRHPKPDPEGIHMALKRLDVSRQAALFIGDSLDDIGAARAAGIEVLIIVGGENKRNDLLEAVNPDALSTGYDELLERFDLT